MQFYILIWTLLLSLFCKHIVIKVKEKKTLSFFHWLSCNYLATVKPFYVCKIDSFFPSTRDLLIRASYHPGVFQVFATTKEIRAARFFLNDPDIGEQQLFTGPYGKKHNELRRYTHNLLELWKSGITGKNIVVSVVDDGIDVTHPELSDNFDPRASFDFVANQDSPHTTSEPHGTKCAGLIAAKANNSLCGVGAAYGVRIGAIRIMAEAVGEVYDVHEALAFNHRLDIIDIYSMSWGPLDDGKKRARPTELVSRALEIGATTGRNGKGSIYLFASGNGGPHSDRCHADGYLQEYAVTAIGSMSSNGEMPPYAEPCSAILGSTLSNADRRPESKIYTTHPMNGCGRSHTGTSVSAPIAAALIALVLDFDSSLTRREIENLIVLTAVQTDPKAIKNAAGHSYSLNFGYGLIDAKAMIGHLKSGNFVRLPPLSVCRTQYYSVETSLELGGTVTSSIYSSGCLNSPHKTTSLEVVIVSLSVNTATLSTLSGYLTSPSGTRIPFLEPRILDDSSEGLVDWDVKIVSFYGERSFGVWHLELTSEKPHHIELVKWGLTFYGTLDPNMNATKSHLDTMDLICSSHKILKNHYLSNLCVNPLPVQTHEDDFDKISFIDSSNVFSDFTRKSSNHLSFFFNLGFIFFCTVIVFYLLYKLYLSMLFFTCVSESPTVIPTGKKNHY